MKQTQKGFTLIELMIVVAIIGILAAIAIPQYNDYTAKAQASEAFSLLDGLKSPITAAYSEDGQWAIPSGSVTAGKYVSGIAASGTTLTATYKSSGVNNKVSGKTVVFTFSTTDGSWTCSSDLESTVKPKSC